MTLVPGILCAAGGWNSLEVAGGLCDDVRGLSVQARLLTLPATALSQTAATRSASQTTPLLGAASTLVATPTPRPAPRARPRVAVRLAVQGRAGLNRAATSAASPG